MLIYWRPELVAEWQLWTHFTPLFHFYTPYNRQKTRVVLEKCFRRKSIDLLVVVFLPQSFYSLHFMGSALILKGKEAVSVTLKQFLSVLSYFDTKKSFLYKCRKICDILLECKCSSILILIWNLPRQVGMYPSQTGSYTT